MIIPYCRLVSDGYLLCVPELVKLNNGSLGNYLCALKVTTGKIFLRAIQAKVFLESGYMAVDENGTSLTLLDPDLDRKLVVIGDLNLYFALKQDQTCLNNVWVEVVSELPKGRKWYY